MSKRPPRRNHPGRRKKQPNNRPHPRGGKSFAQPGELPEIGVVEITGLDIDGEMLGRPAGFQGNPPSIVVVAERGAPALGVGERAAVRFSRIGPRAYEARIIRALGGAPNRVLGIYRLTPEGGRIEPTERKVRSEFRVAAGDTKGALDGEIVLAEVLSGARLGLPEARIVERIGNSADPRAFSLIAIHGHGIPTEFPKAAVDLANAARPVALGNRADLRAVPLVTIDGADARDFDDAVWAEPDPERADGWHALVAIADVAWYVRPGDALDKAARERGNSVYFPDRVVPMLPEALSNELCSLKPDEERACMAVDLWIDAEGRLDRHRFRRGLMRSAARLTYEEAQEAIDGRPDAKTAKLVDPVLRPLYGVYRALERARASRGTIELDIPERKILLGPSGRIERIEPRQRLESHKLIEELMIAANVAAAESLERLKQPCMYRVHDVPDPVKIGELARFLGGLGIHGLTLAKGQVIRPQHFNAILRRAQGTPYAALVHQLVLRTQSQAEYNPENIGHFGLSLRRYAHFTSPIRRYADLLVHRGLIAGHRFGTDGLPGQAEDFKELGQHISMTERRAAAAERSAGDRYVAAFLAERVGAEFKGRINGVTRAGLFVTLDETGADGFIPMRSLGDDYYIHDETRHCLRGRRTGRIYTMGDAVTARLSEADTVTGSLQFALTGDADRPSGGKTPQRSGRRRR